MMNNYKVMRKREERKWERKLEKREKRKEERKWEVERK
jgi:hypothetical protein